MNLIDQINQLAVETENAKASAMAEYRSLIHRAESPDPDDATTVTRLLGTLGLTGDDLQRDIAAVRKSRWILSKMSETEQRELTRQSVIEEIENYDRARRNALGHMVAGVSNPEQFFSVNSMWLTEEHQLEHRRAFTLANDNLIRSQLRLQDLDNASVSLNSQLNELRQAHDRVL